MKKIVCLWVIMLFSVSVAIGQRSKKPVPVSKFNQAETAWGIFLPKFRLAIRAKDYELVKAMMAKDIACSSKEWFEAKERGEHDLREVCISYWKTSKKGFANDLDWNDLQVILNRYVQKIEKEARGVTRSITYAKKYNDCSNDDLFAAFIFSSGSWFLKSFEHGECGD